MRKQLAIGGLVVFAVWCLLDYVLHGVLLARSYEATAALWRPMAEMKRGVETVAVLIAALAFTGIYERLIAPKSMSAAIWYGLLFGFAVGAPMAYGTFAVMPIPYSMALSWFLGSLVKGLAGGAALGALIRE